MLTLVAYLVAFGFKINPEILDWIELKTKAFVLLVLYMILFGTFSKVLFDI